MILHASVAGILKLGTPQFIKRAQRAQERIGGEKDMQTQPIKNKYGTPEEFREWCLGMADNMYRNYRASVRAMALLTGTVGEGLNPRIYCGECVQSFSEKRT